MKRYVRASKDTLYVDFYYKNRLIGSCKESELMSNSSASRKNLINKLVLIMEADGTVRDAIFDYLNGIYEGANTGLNDAIYLEDHSSLGEAELLDSFLDEIKAQVYDAWTFNNNGHRDCNLDIEVTYR